MLKLALLASALTVASPVLAQEKPAAAQAGRTPMAEPAAPAQPAAEPAAPVQQAPVAAAQPVAPTEQPAAETATAPAQPAAMPTPATQVADVVGKEFPGYDANKDGNLSQTEFASWMVALKKASDPTTTADSPATQSWVGAAFAQADADKNKSVSQSELTGFLSQGQS